MLKNQSLISQLESLEDLYADAQATGEAAWVTEKIWSQITVLRKRLQLPYTNQQDLSLIGKRSGEGSVQRSV